MGVAQAVERHALHELLALRLKDFDERARTLPEAFYRGRSNEALAGFLRQTPARSTDFLVRHFDAVRAECLPHLRDLLNYIGVDRRRQATVAALVYLRRDVGLFYSTKDPAGGPYATYGGQAADAPSLSISFTLLCLWEEASNTSH
jgi:hypothetical protein